ncbi:MAG: hypothetical protein KJ941_02055 [Bacteroidetes bacterium]|nr:hypothetical protein [Bacteroidota bacterium]
MNTSALITMLTTHGIVIFCMVYFFRRVLKSPSQPEPDSYTDNDEVV